MLKCNRIINVRLFLRTKSLWVKIFQVLQPDLLQSCQRLLEKSSEELHAQTLQSFSIMRKIGVVKTGHLPRRLWQSPVDVWSQAGYLPTSWHRCWWDNIGSMWFQKLSICFYITQPSQEFGFHRDHCRISRWVWASKMSEQIIWSAQLDRCYWVWLLVRQQLIIQSNNLVARIVRWSKSKFLTLASFFK